MSSSEFTISVDDNGLAVDSVIPYSINEALVQEMQNERQEMQNERQKAGCPIQRTLHQQANHTGPVQHTGPAQHVATLQDMHTDGMNRCNPSLNFSCSSPLYIIHGQHRG